jgi:hypothetical protein
MPTMALAYFLIPYVPIWVTMLIYLVIKIRASTGDQIPRLGYLAIGFHVTALCMLLSWTLQGGIYEAAAVFYIFCTSFQICQNSLMPT